MKTKTIQNLLMCACVLLAVRGNSQVFQSGSDGSYGPMNIGTNTTLDLPPDGIFHCTTIIVSNGATLKFRRNSLNTPVYLLATGDVTIAGTIDLTGTAGGQARAGEGGPGGFDGGQPAVTSGLPGGDGHGPGGGKAFNPFYAGGGSYAKKPSVTGNNPHDGSIYGTPLLTPLVGGSGGGGQPGNPGLGGSGGGGAVLIASNTRITVPNTGIVRARGTRGPFTGTYSYGGGSGGAIRFVAPIVAGVGTFDVSGDFWGGDGRIRVDTLDRSGWNFSFSGSTTYGSRMFVFSPFTNRLDILQAAGQIISEGTQSSVSIELPTGASTNQTVTVQARGFTNNVPIFVVVTPDNGSSSNYLAEIVMTNNPAQITVPVIIPAGMASRIHAWTR